MNSISNLYIKLVLVVSLLIVLHPQTVNAQLGTCPRGAGDPAPQDMCECVSPGTCTPYYSAQSTCPGPCGVMGIPGVYYTATSNSCPPPNEYGNSG
ncbi:MAG: hypothetical protein AAB874_04320, partial [Patescibacteria group bacterium]